VLLTTSNNLFLQLIIQTQINIYQFDVLSQDEATQRHGLVTVLFLSPDLLDWFLDPSLQRENDRFVQAMPVRCTAVHMCYHLKSVTVLESAVYRAIQLLVMTLMGEEMRRVTTIHTRKFCTHAEGRD
jgi:hypothetical protein